MANKFRRFLKFRQEYIVFIHRGGVKGLIAGLAAFLLSISILVGLSITLNRNVLPGGLIPIIFLLISAPLFAATFYVLTKDKRAVLGPLLLAPLPLMGQLIGIFVVIAASSWIVVPILLIGIVAVPLVVLSLPARTTKGKIILATSTVASGILVVIPSFLLNGDGSIISYLLFYSGPTIGTTATPFEYPITGLPVFGAFYGAGWALSRAVEEQVG